MTSVSRSELFEVTLNCNLTFKYMSAIVRLFKFMNYESDKRYTIINYIGVQRWTVGVAATLLIKKKPMNKPDLLHVLENTFDRKRISTNPKPDSNP